MGEPPEPATQPGSAGLIQGIGLWQATALNVTLIVGAGVFATIPPMLHKLPGPYALLPWLAAGLRKKHQSSKANAIRRNTDEDSY